jgi:hypothetical protein
MNFKRDLKNDRVKQFFYKNELFEPEIYCNNNVLSRKIDLTNDGYLHYRVVRHNVDDLLKDKNFSYSVFTKMKF